MIITVKYATEDGKVHDSAEAAVDHGTALDICNRFGLDIDEDTVAGLVREMQERDGVLAQLRQHKNALAGVVLLGSEDATPPASGDATQP